MSFSSLFAQPEPALQIFPGIQPANIEAGAVPPSPMRQKKMEREVNIPQERT